MFYTLCGVADFRVLEVGPYFLGAALGAPQVTPHVLHHLYLVARTPPPHRVGLDILIEQLVWVEIRAVAPKEKEVNLPPVACQPSLHTPGHMHWMLVDDEKDFASRMTDQPLQEHDKCEGGELLAEDHEGHLSAVGDGGDQVVAEALSRPRDNRGFSSPSVGGAGLMVGPHPHLVAPVNRGSLASGAGPDGRILSGQPVPHRLGFPLWVTIEKVPDIAEVVPSQYSSLVFIIAISAIGLGCLCFWFAALRKVRLVEGNVTRSE